MSTHKYLRVKMNINEFEFWLEQLRKWVQMSANKCK